MIAYHVYLLIRKDKTTVELNECPLAPVQPANAEVTFSVVEVCQPQCDPLGPDTVKSGDIQQIENPPNITLSYQ